MMSCLNSKHLHPGTAKYRYMIPLFSSMTFVVQFDESTYNLALPKIIEDLDITASAAQWLITAYFLGTAAFSVPVSKIASKYGYLCVTFILMLGGLSLYLLSYFCQNFYLLVLLRFATGSMTAGIHAVRNAM